MRVKCMVSILAMSIWQVLDSIQLICDRLIYQRSKFNSQISTTVWCREEWFRRHKQWQHVSTIDLVVRTNGLFYRYSQLCNAERVLEHSSTQLPTLSDTVSSEPRQASSSGLSTHPGRSEHTAGCGRKYCRWTFAFFYLFIAIEENIFFHRKFTYTYIIYYKTL